MRALKAHIVKIKALINEGTTESLTYAALECRLAIEFVCYERLRISHKYISQKDIRRWQPKDVVNILIREVDEHTASTFTLSFSPTPIMPDGRQPNQEDYRSPDWKELGTQVGFDPAKFGKLWHALSSFLHAKASTIQTTPTIYYNESAIIRDKVIEALLELERISNGTLISNGFGESVSFECDCGAKNMRRVSPLQDGQTISCINPECKESWTVMLGEEITFRRKAVRVKCHACGLETSFPEQPVLDLGRNQVVKFACECGAENSFGWRLMQATSAEE